MRLEIGEHVIEANTTAEINKLMSQYMLESGLGNQQYMTNAKLDGKQLIIMGTSMVDDITVEPLAVKAIKDLALLLDSEKLSDNDIIERGCDNGSFPKLKDALINAVKEIYDIEIMYIWDEY